MRYAKKICLAIMLLNICCIHTFTVKAEELKYSIPKSQDSPIILNEDLLSKLFPELKNPRLMTLQDLSDSDEQNFFQKSGYQFALEGDFNKDKFPDIVFVGKYTNTNDPEKNSFLAIVSLKEGKLTREYFSRIMSPLVALRKVLNYKPKIDAILVIYKFGSEECEFLYWTGTKYRFEPCQAVF